MHFLEEGENHWSEASCICSRSAEGNGSRYRWGWKGEVEGHRDSRQPRWCCCQEMIIHSCSHDLNFLFFFLILMFSLIRVCTIWNFYLFLHSFSTSSFFIAFFPTFVFARSNSFFSFSIFLSINFYKEYFRVLLFHLSLLLKTAEFSAFIYF